MNQTPGEADGRLETIRADWLAKGASTAPADRERAEWSVRRAIEATGRPTHSMLFIWVQSPMAGVLASTYVGFSLSAPMANRILKPRNDVLARSGIAAARLRRDVDAALGLAGAAVSTQLGSELAVRGATWETWRRDVGNYAWNQVWETIGDPLYSQGWEQQARDSEGLFEKQLESWADVMIEGQFGAGTMAQLDASGALAEVDVTPFDGVRGVAENCAWWWPYEVGAVMCERPARFVVSGAHVEIEFRDGWTVQT